MGANTPVNEAWYEIDSSLLANVFEWVRQHNNAVMDHSIYKQVARSQNSLRFLDEEELAKAFGVEDL